MFSSILVRGCAVDKGTAKNASKKVSRFSNFMQNAKLEPEALSYE